MKTKEPGSINVKQITESIKTIELLTTQYKKKRLSTDKYIQQVHENLAKLTNERDYIKYLKSIGQNG
jgi:hypothetical protein